MFSVGFALVFCVIAAAAVSDEPARHSEAQYQLYNEIETRIIGGSEAKPHSYPYAVHLKIQKNRFMDACGGSLISQRYVLTAAHCLESGQKATVTLGVHNIEKNEVGEIKLTVTEDNFKIHPGYTRFPLANDIALIKLPNAIRRSPTIDFAKLPSIVDRLVDLTGWNVTAIGWGITDPTIRETSPVLKQLLNKVQPAGRADANVIAVKPYSATAGACAGDSGSPLLTLGGVQVGVASYVTSLLCTNSTAYYTDVRKYITWIRLNMIL